MRIYDWRLVQDYYNAGHSFRECIEKFGFSRGAWHKARNRGELRPRPAARPLHDLLRTSRCRTSIKSRLIREGYLENRCRECGLSEWMGERLTIQLDHINGDGKDYRLENLRMLCPNCHSQTETYGRLSRDRRRELQERRQVV